MNKKKISNIIIDNLKTIFIALLIATAIRSFFFQPFYIPSSSMEPTLLIGDRIFVSKYTYGFSKHSFPFSPNIFSGRINYNIPAQGDLVVFKTPADNRTDYIKRVVGLPGDSIQFIKGEIFINNEKIKRKKINSIESVRCGKFTFVVNAYEETLPNGKKHISVYNSQGTLQNRDCSNDSRFLESVGYVNFINLVGKAQIIFFSNDTIKGSILKFWNLNNSFRIDRLFKKIK